LLIDTHCHLTDATLLAQHADVLARAADAGVARMITVATSPEDWDKALALIAASDRLYMAAGVHPHKAGQVAPDAIERLEAVQARPKVVAVGEIGLEYHYDFSPRDRQHEIFAAQLQLARRLNKPVVVHSRDSMADTLAILDEQGMDGWPLVFHCFTSGPVEAREILRRGWYISLAGVVTFKNAVDVQEAAKLVPADRLLFETDSPYLAPEPVRRVRPNEPAHVAHTARFLAQLRSVRYEELVGTCWANACRLFGLSPAV
jgi:TatD DNase family protein